MTPTLGAQAGGKGIPESQYTGDLGAADPHLAAALSALARDPAREPEVLAALAAARVLVPVVAVADDGPDDGPDATPGDQQASLPAGRLRREKSTDMALVTLEGADGRRALPVFSSLETLARWDPAARPVPVDARRAALSAAAEGARVIVLDVAGPTTYVVTGSAVRRLAAGDRFIPAYADPDVAAAVRHVLAAEGAVVRGWLLPATGADARLALAVRGTPDGPAVTALARRVAERLRHTEAVRRVVRRGVELTVLPRGAEPAQPSVFRRGLLD